MLSSCVRKVTRPLMRVLPMWLVPLFLTWAAASSAHAAITLPAPDVATTSYQLVSKTRVSSIWPWSQYAYVYKIEVHNGSANVLNRVVGKVSTSAPQIEIVDDEVLVGSLQPNQSLLSGDTFTIHSHKFFDRRLDAKIFQNGHWYFDDDNLDPDDQYVPTHDNGKPGQDLEVFYQHKLSKIFQWSFTYTPDADSPVITNKLPTGLINQARPTVSASYSDVGSAVDAAGVGLSVDGTNVTSAATISEASIQYQPANPLTDGEHTVQLTVPDLAGNVATTSWTFTIDATAPHVSNTLPANNALVSGAPTISVQYTDGAAPASGVNASGVRLYVDDQDVTASAQVAAAQLTYTPTQGLADGVHSVRVVVPDVAGNVNEAAWSFSVDSVLPAISVISPADGSVLELSALPTIEGGIAETGSGIEPASLVVQLDGQTIPVQLNVEGTSFTYTLTQPLSEGTHSVVASVSDRAGNTGSASWQFKNAQPPVISNMMPFETMLPGDAMPEISASFSDEGSGVDVSSVRISVDGQDVTSTATISSSQFNYQVGAPLHDGGHIVIVAVSDIAGNQVQREWQFGTATPPVISNLSPKDVVLPPGSAPTISAQFADPRVGLDLGSVHMTVNGLDVTAQATVASGGISYTPTQPIPTGPVTVYVEVANTTNATAAEAWGFDIAEAPVYSLQFVTPQGSQSVLASELQARVTASSNKAGVQAVTINGQPTDIAFSADGETVHYVANIKLQDGDNQLLAEATFSNGEVRQASSQVTFDAPPRVVITAPTDKLTLGAVNPNSPRDLTGSVERPFSVTGNISKPAQSVTINQQLARLENGGTSFRFDNFFLHEGVNLITAVATDTQGRVSSAAVTVSVDQTAPIVLLENPVPGYVTSNSRIDVRGLANDAVEGFSGAPEPVVTVTNVGNGQTVRAEVLDRYFLAVGVPLVVGQNHLTVTATDQVGNVRTQDVSVSRVAAGSERLTLLSGNYQKGPMHAQLPQPLTVVALNATGEPMAGVPVSFDVTRGTGWISSESGVVQKPDGVNPARNLVVQTDERGYARAWLTPGKQSGVGAHVVRAWVNGASLAEGASGRAVSEDVYFMASAEHGAPTRVLAEMGTNQFAETRSQPLELLSAVVRDEFENVISGAPVKFRINAGDAYFGAVGVTEAVVTTDKNGYAAVRPTIGDRPGLIRINASTKANPVDAASADISGCSYLIQAREPASGPASFEGHVYTDKGEALPGVRISIGRTSLTATSDESGFFRIDSVPPGRIDLFVDGRTSNHLNETWPALHFEVIAIRGVENRLPHPIYLPPLAMTQAKMVGGNEDVILTIPGLEGFQMKVKANSVTFPDGSHVGTLVVSPVTGDRLPMTPPGGAAMFGTPAWTIQPAGARFDPPIEVTMPNTLGRRPGETVPVVQWDHDLAQYVPMGHATVSEDGVFVVTDAGSGVTKAGWGGTPGQPPGPCAQDQPPECNECEIYAEESFGSTCTQQVCLTDEAKDGLPFNRLDVILAKFSFEKKFRERTYDRFIEKLKEYGGLKTSVVVKGETNIKITDICCVLASRGKTFSTKLEFGAGVEYKAEWEWIKISRFLKGAAGWDGAPSAITEVNAFFDVGSQSGDLIWNDCEQQGEGLVRTNFGMQVIPLTVVVSGEIEVNGVKVPMEWKLVDASVVGAGTADFSPYGQDLRKGIYVDGEWSIFIELSAFETQIGDWKLTPMTFTWDSEDRLEGPVPVGGD